jgi:hypothetical protein
VDDAIRTAALFGAALADAARSGDWTNVYPYLTADVEWVTPKRTLVGIDEVEHDLTWGRPPENLDVDFEVGEWADLGRGRAAVDVVEVYRVKGSGDFAYRRGRRIEVTIHAGKVKRYEMAVVG